MPKTKKESAEKLLADIRSMGPSQIQKILDDETDPELIRFLREHSSEVILANLHQPDKAAFILILIGYLMRAREEKDTIWLSPKGKA
jgi:hypothetical protein